MFDLETVDQLLTTTRSVRKRLDFSRPIEPEVIERCLDVAIQAPSGSDQQRWHFVVVTDPDLKKGIGDLYRKSFEKYYAAGRSADDDTPRSPLEDSAVYLSEHFHEVPAMVIFCYEGRVERSSQANQAGVYGSILPAAWSFMLALRSRGIGAAWTTLHLVYEREVAALLGLPEKITQAVLFPIAYYTGDDFKPAKRVPARERTYWNGWGN